MATIVTRAGKGSALTWTEGDANITNLNNAKIENVVEDLTPQLGGDLDINGKSIVSTSNGNIAITPNGTGSIVLDGLNWPQADGTADYVLKTNGSGQLSWTAMAGGGDVVNDTTPQLGGDLDVNGHAITTTALTLPIELKSNYLKIGEASATGITWLTTAGAQNLYLGPQDISYSHILIAKNANGNISIVPDGTGKIILDGLSWPTADGTSDQVLKTDGAGNLSWTTVTSGATNLDGLSDVVITAAATNDVLVYNGTNWVDTAANTLTVSAASTATTATNATNATNVNIGSTDGNTADTTTYVALAGSLATGNQQLHLDGGLFYNASTNALTATTFVGALSGNATNVSGTVALANGGTGQTSAPAAMAALMGFTTTATAAGTTVLSNSSTCYQVFTGSTTQTITLPVTSTLATGWTFHICNNSTGNLTVNSSGANAVITVLPGTTAMVTCILTSGTTAASWEAGLTDFSTASGTGSVVLGTSPSISGLTLTGTLTAGGGVGTSGQVLQSTGSGIQWATAGGSGPSIAWLSITSPMGTLVTGTTYTVSILEETDPSGIVTVSANTFTLAAGTYLFRMVGVLRSAGDHYMTLRRNTNTATTLDNFTNTIKYKNTSNVNAYDIRDFGFYYVNAATNTFEWRLVTPSADTTVTGNAAWFEIIKIA